MSLDQNAAVAGYHKIGAPDTSGGFPAGASVGTRAGFVPGAAAAMGGALYMTPATMSGTQPTIANGGTFTHSGSGVVQVTTGGAVTGTIVELGTHPGQILLLVNNSANTITMAAVGTSNVAGGVGAIVPANAALLLAWNHLNSRWYDVG